MRYWWVNQNQTYRHEVPGGYLWSPKRKANGHNNPFYEFMREVSPGDLIFSFSDGKIRALGLATSFAHEAPKPIEFGVAGRNWSAIGWRVEVSFHEVAKEVRPASWIDVLRPLLPDRYSPLLEDGRGVQSIYLTELHRDLALALANIIGTEALELARAEAVADSVLSVAPDEVVVWERHLERDLETNLGLKETERESLVLARRGQGLFRRRVECLEERCRVTGVHKREHLRASHSKPWRDSSNDERLNGDNGLLLTPSIDHLYDRGFISFETSGKLLISPVAHLGSLARMGVPVDREAHVGSFRKEQSEFLEYHRDSVFLRSQVRRSA